MGNPRRTRNAYLAFTLLGAAGVVTATVLPEAQQRHWLPVTLGIVGFTLVVLCGFATAFHQFDAVRYNRLTSGRDVVARWTVEPRTWAEFLRLNDALNQRPGEPACHLPREKVPRDRGVEVIVGRSAALVGEQFHSLPANGMVAVYGPYRLAGPPACLEYRLWSAGGESGTSHEWAVRLPIAPGAESEADAVVRYYDARKSPHSTPAVAARAAAAARNPPNNRLKRNLFLIVGLLAAAAFAAGLYAVKYHREWANRPDVQTTVMVTMIVGVLLAPAALLLAVVFHLRHRRGR